MPRQRPQTGSLTVTRHRCCGLFGPVSAWGPEAQPCVKGWTLTTNDVIGAEPFLSFRSQEMNLLKTTPHPPPPRYHEFERATHWHEQSCRQRLPGSHSVCSSTMWIFQRILTTFNLCCRLQVLTPLSLLINIVTVGICAFIINPPMGMQLEHWYGEVYKLIFDRRNIEDIPYVNLP